ncbi:MAG: hypothetical protein Q7S58_03115 [Candidatus Binatus sp.]|uniref:hypothetical protein n=1 Tax=Candidatus Binatus sp. TaxID=2811406 RepID=UPI0027207481|nr:hypothetical protein [Candidatus Binatus sp.]MDO8431379.1 hypothetical protein [Candidatus Binatus sp.]
MAFPSQRKIADEKLGLILGQVGSVRRRLNSLALQHAIFFSLAIAIAAGAVIYVGAYQLSALQFLICSAAAIVLGAIGVFDAIRRAWRMKTSSMRAASIVDERAALKDRVATIVALSGKSHRGSLWSYLVEDALSHRNEFAAAKIERRRVSRGIYALAGAVALAMLSLPLARIKHPARIVPGQNIDELTIDLDDLHLRPTEPGEETGMQVNADPATMRRLQDKLMRENPQASGGEGNSITGLMNHAREMAGKFQSKLTGEQSPKQRLNLRLADNGGGLERNEIRRRPELSGKKSREDAAGQFQRGQPETANKFNLEHDPDASGKPAQPSGNRADLGAQSGGKGRSSGQDDALLDHSSDQNGDAGSNGGASHGIGADPDSLFGAPTQAKLGTEGFEIAIEARPVDKGAKGAGQAYVPPKVRTPLNADQQPDEPVARASVPPEDRATIKKVFER